MSCSFNHFFQCLELLSYKSAELQICSVTVNSIFFSWTVTSGSVVDGYEIVWKIYHDQFVTFRDSLPPVSFNSYTVNGLQDCGDATISITVTAYNSGGSATSSSLNIAANIAAGSGTLESPNSLNSDFVIIGAAVGGCVILAIAVVTVVVTILIYHYKSKKNQKEPVYT